MTEPGLDGDAPILAREARPRGPLVFISHDSRDADLAEAFSKLLASVSAGMLKNFRSSDRKGLQGIDFGVEWYPELMRQLDAACDVVCLLTSRSLERPWILYEAGVAKGKLDIPVHGLALGVPLARVGIGPFAQFQNCDDDADALCKLIEQLVRRLPHADPDHDTVMNQVAQFKAKIAVILTNYDDSEDGSEVGSDDASSAKLFEEVKVMFQDLPSRIESIADPRRRRGRRISPALLDEFLFLSTRGESNVGLASLILTAPFRDDLPWIYTMATEVYRASLSGDRRTVREAYSAMQRALETLRRSGSLAREMFPSGRELDMLIHELPRLLDMNFRDLIDSIEETPEKVALANDSARPEASNR